MSFKLLYTNLAGPQGDFLVDPATTFEAGMLGMLQGSTTGSPTGLPVVELATSGTSGTIIGIIDDNKTTSFIATVKDEFVASGSTTLAKANVVSGTIATPTGSFVSFNWNGFNYTNGTLAFPASGVGTNLVSYSYIIPGKAGDDTTLASGKCTLWLQPGEYSTDVYELVGTGTKVQDFAVGAPLYCSNNSKLTTASGSSAGPVIVGYVTKTPSAGNPYLNFYKV